MADKKRNTLTTRIDVDDNLEFDYLSVPEINFAEFPSIESTYVVTQNVLNRIDLVSYRVYGNPYYWWVIAKRNNIIDVYDDLYVGMKLYIPNLSDLFSYMAKRKIPKVAGNKKYAGRRL